MKSSLLLMSLMVLSMAGCAPHGPAEHTGVSEQSPPPLGWQKIGTTSCYRAPNFSGLPAGERRKARGDALYEVTRRWQGKVDPAFQLPPELVDAIENLLLEKPQYTQQVVDEDFELCRRWAGGTLTQAAYADALTALLEDLKQGLCSHESYELVTQYIKIDRRWQFDLTICKGERVTIKASHGYYTVEGGNDGQPVWITAEGDRTRPTAGTEYPCALEGCYVGQLVGRFVDTSGNETVFPVNFDAYFAAPADGSLSFEINDTTLYDNRFRVVDGVEDFLLVEIRPASSRD